MGIKSSIPLCFGSKLTDDFDITLQKSDGTRSERCPLHWHDCFEILYVTSGSRGISINDQNFILSEGDIAVIPPHSVHYTYKANDFPCSSIVFGYTEPIIYTSDISFSNMKYLAPFRYMKSGRNCVLRGDSDWLSDLRALLTKGSEIFFAKGTARELRMRSVILEIHALLYEIFMFSAEKDERSLGYLLDAQIYIENHITEKISPYDVADAIHISYSHLARIARSSMNLTVSELITQLRINLAEQLLMTDREMSITDCALASGFDDVSYFIKIFRSAKGVSPGKFRKLATGTQALGISGQG